MQSLTKVQVLFGVAALLTAFAFYGLFLDHLFVVEDVNMEAMDMPLTVAHLERAREKGVPSMTYFRSDPIWENLKKENPQGAHAYFDHRFQFEFFACQCPLLSVLFLPFVKLAGVSTNTVTLYSTFFAGVAWLATGALGWRMFGRWSALLAMLFLTTSLSWLIHVKGGYAAHTPSACLIVALAFTVDIHLQSRRRWTLVTMGGLLGLMYLVGWLVVVFGALMVGLALTLGGSRRIREMLTHLAVVTLVSLAAILVFTLGYAFYHHCSLGDIHRAILAVMFGRFSQGGVPGQELTLAGKLAFAFRCMFWDMRTVDHPDKYLAGSPAIPLIFSLFLIAGLLYAIKERKPGDRTLLIWLISVFGVLGSLFLFTHRYALLALPAMSLLAARGVLGVASDLFRWKGRIARGAFISVVGLLLGWTLLQTHHQYYVEYTLHKPADFEVDRARGHHAFSKWLKEHHRPGETLVVLGDPILFPHTGYLFNTFGWDYPFAYWSNRFRTGSTPEQVQAWERETLKKYRMVVYAFPSQLLGDPRTNQFMNDWRPFMAAHPGLKPSFTYSYDDRSPSIFAFEITAPVSAPKTR